MYEAYILGCLHEISRNVELNFGNSLVFLCCFIWSVVSLFFLIELVSWTLFNPLYCSIFDVISFILSPQVEWMNRDVNIKLRVIFAPCLSSWIVLLLFVLILYMVCSGRIHFQKQSLSSPFPDCNILCFFFLTLFSNRMPIVHFFFLLFEVW